MTTKAFDDAIFIIQLTLSQIVLYTASIIHFRGFVVDEAFLISARYVFGEGPHDTGAWFRAALAMMAIVLFLLSVLQAAYLFFEALGWVLNLFL